ncbi:MAG: hypothetical protein WC247_14480, partial [Porticoccaceae bacterium]
MKTKQGQQTDRQDRKGDQSLDQDDAPVAAAGPPGKVTPGTVTPGTVTPGTVTPGTVTPGTVIRGTPCGGGHDQKSRHEPGIAAKRIRS